MNPGRPCCKNVCPSHARPSSVFLPEASHILPVRPGQDTDDPHHPEDHLRNRPGNVSYRQLLFPLRLLALKFSEPLSPNFSPSVLPCLRFVYPFALHTPLPKSLSHASGARDFQMGYSPFPPLVLGNGDGG